MPRRAARTEPVRTCIGCRSTATRRELVRIVRQPDGGVAFDPTGRAPGRGAYVHPTEACIEGAWSANRLNRALRVRLGSAQAASLMKELRETIGEDA